MRIATCSKCIYWKPDEGQGKTIKEGLCLERGPQMLASSRGRWPMTLYNEGCGQGWEAAWDEDEVELIEEVTLEPSATNGD